MAGSESGMWARAAAIASLAAAVAIPVGIQFGTAVFCMVAGPIALIAGFRAYCEALSRNRPRDVMPAQFAILIGGIETFFLVGAVIRWWDTGVFPTK